MAQKAHQHGNKGQARTTAATPAPAAASTALESKASEGSATKEELTRIVQLFKEMPTHFKDEIRKELGASGIVRQKKRHRVSNESAASVVHTVGDVIHPPGHIATAPEWVYEKGEAVTASWEKRWEDGRPFITEGNLAYEYDEYEFSASDMVGELAPTG